MPRSNSPVGALPLVTVLLALIACGDGKAPPLGGGDLGVQVSADTGTKPTTSDAGISMDATTEIDMGVQLPRYCRNGLHDQALGESDIDCGGDCLPCAFGQACNTPADCGFGLSCGPDGICDRASCEDGIQNGEETDVDCVGSECITRCDQAQGCQTNADCDQLRCTNGLCEPASCSDGILNGDESDVDCGGTRCGPCTVGQRCVFRSDCPDDTEMRTECVASSFCALTGTTAVQRREFACANGSCSVRAEESEEICQRPTENLACGPEQISPWTQCAHHGVCSLEGRQERTISRSTCQMGACVESTRTATQACGQRQTDGDFCATPQDWGAITCVLNNNNICTEQGRRIRNEQRCLTGQCLPPAAVVQNCRVNKSGRQCGSECRDTSACRCTGMRGGRRCYRGRECRARRCNSEACNGSGGWSGAGERHVGRSCS